jgi:hypothetical protein
VEFSALHDNSDSAGRRGLDDLNSLRGRRGWLDVDGHVLRIEFIGQGLDADVC